MFPRNFGTGVVGRLPVDFYDGDRNFERSDRTQGSVSYLFHIVGLMTFPGGTDEGRLMQVALEAGAEDVVPNADTSIEVLADPVEFETVRAILSENGFVPSTAEITERASLTMQVSGEAGELLMRLLEALEDLDDVRDVYSNVEISDEVLALI